MKNKKFIVVFALITSFLTVTYLARDRSPEEVSNSNFNKEMASISQEDLGVSLSLATQQKKATNGPSSENKALVDTDEEKYQSLFDDSIDMDTNNIQEQELVAFRERLRFKPYPVQVFFEQESATYEEWSLAYETEICQCKTKTCMKSLENDYLKFPPPFSNKIQTDTARTSMHRVIACVNSVSVN